MPPKARPTFVVPGLLLAAAGVFAATGASARSTPTMGVDEIQRGMKGYGLTVFHGTEPERFEIEVVDVIRNYLPKQDAIMFRSLDPRMEHSGIVGGMSGSPIYINDKLVGALAYGYRFNKDPLGGITPISNMLDVDKLPFRPDVLPRPKLLANQTPNVADVVLGLDSSPLPPRSRPKFGGGYERLGVPMSMSGFGPATAAWLGDTLGMEPVRGGTGAGGPPKKTGKRSWGPGDSVSVVLADGDNAVSPNGTVTWVGSGGKHLLAFGHPMFGDGPSNIPIADAHVHTIIPSVARSVKISSALTVQGTMIQDRQAAIALRAGQSAPMIPLRTTLHPPEPTGGDRVYENRLAVGVGMTPNIAAGVLADAVEEGARDGASVSLKLRHRFSVVTDRGPRTVEIVEEGLFPYGVSGQALARTRGIATLGMLLDSPYGMAEVLDVQQEVSIRYGSPYREVASMSVPREEVRAGETLELRLELRDIEGRRFHMPVPITIPANAGGESIRIVLEGGNGALPYLPPARDLDGLLNAIEQSYPARSVVATVYRQSEGLATPAGLLHELPPSVAESLRGEHSTHTPLPFKRAARNVIPTSEIIDGHQALTLDVLPARRP